MALVIKHQTPEQFLARVRAAYRDGDAELVGKISERTLAAISDGDLTDEACRAAFGLTVARWNTLKNKMRALATARRTIRSAVGE